MKSKNNRMKNRFNLHNKVMITGIILETMRYSQKSRV